MRIPPDVRADVVRYTSDLTNEESDPVAVVVNASPLVGWLEDAADEADLEIRCMALREQHANCFAVDPDDDPDRFLAQARTIYAFLTAGTTAEQASAADVRGGSDEPEPAAVMAAADRSKTQDGPGAAYAEAADGSHHLAKGASDPMNTTMADPAAQNEARPAVERLLTPGEVAALFRVDPKTVTRWAAAGRIASIRTPGGHRRFRESLVRSLLAGEEVG
jgi:excisionase family DNA binding protein